ncbi:hypothetical protein HETIRDRAFT_174200 [Heterobasidion irregulare TC 32-1]|uniref:Uncharacterized protein n=1 Tax=Heterobasidion irregulare (strain TC 32-1) TaxID=747525 RepID=W4JUD1_HETIT|nr:uncharacterized protein HETIRDRAFT_174200 [Heterobasidion irregulare TC 32-1]ETW77157.1 hypothetical protein HETIRDRAFT_174200 [Heterobasidion irregulare TC 32-1]
MMWSWIKNMLIYDLVRTIEDLEEKMEVDNVTIKKLCTYLKRDHKIHCTRDSLLNMIASCGH